MLTPGAFNRSRIKEYLHSVSEDELVNDIIIPLFSKSGYMLLRRVKDGPGEHGKDIIFFRHMPLFYDNEYIVVQAKAEKVTASNVAKFADQVKRAFLVPFPAKGGETRKPNYVAFINSGEHTNDAEFEFSHLAGYQQNVKILHRDNLIDLILKENVVPEKLIGKLEEYDLSDNNLEKKIEVIIGSGNNLKINRFLDHELHLYTKALSQHSKAFVVNYIFHLWDEDRTFEGTVRPMKWLNRYLHFIQPDQYPKLFEVVSEYTSSYHSFDAYDDTKEIVRKITPTQIKAFEKDFIELVVKRFKNENGLNAYPLIIQLLQAYRDSEQLNAEFIPVIKLMDRQVELLAQMKKEKDKEEKKKLLTEYRSNDSDLYYFLYPNEKEDYS
jgi:hypothetical protein